MNGMKPTVAQHLEPFGLAAKQLLRLETHKIGITCGEGTNRFQGGGDRVIWGVVSAPHYPFLSGTGFAESLQQS